MSKGGTANTNAQRRLPTYSCPNPGHRNERRAASDGEPRRPRIIGFPGAEGPPIASITTSQPVQQEQATQVLETK